MNTRDKLAIFILILLFLLIGSTFVTGQTSSTICEGSPDPEVTVTPSGGTSPYLVIWTRPGGALDTTNTKTLDTVGIWQWVVEDATACATSGGSHTLTMEPDPTDSLVINAVNKCSASGQTISASAVPAGYTYAWNFGSGASPATSTTPAVNVTYSTGGTKTITLTITKAFPGVGTSCAESCVWVKTKDIIIGTLTGVAACN